MLPVWVNAPFALIGKVYALIKQQQVAAAVVVPKGTKKWWAPFFSSNAEGVVWRWDLGRFDNRCQMVGDYAPAAPRAGLSVVFFDFRRRGTAAQFTPVVAAETLWRAWLGEGRPQSRRRFFRPDGSWVDGEPRRPVPHTPKL